MATLDQEVTPAQASVEVVLEALTLQYFQLSQGAGAATAELITKAERFGRIGAIVLGALTVLCLAITLAATRLISRRLRDTNRALKESTGIGRKMPQRSEFQPYLADGSSFAGASSRKPARHRD